MFQTLIMFIVIGTLATLLIVFLLMVIILDLLLNSNKRDDKNG